MRLNIERLEKARLSGGKLIARCPVCAEAGADRRCEHLVIFDTGNGAYRCIADPDGPGSDHSRRIHKLVGFSNKIEGYFGAKHALSAQPRKPPACLNIPRLRRLKYTEICQIAALRKWPYIAGLELLNNRGLLTYGEVFDAGRHFPSWIITDSARRNIQARRMDGKLWDGIGGAKAKSIPGSEASWPIGATDIGDRPIVVLTEGMPDFCSVLLVAWYEGLPTTSVAPVAMTGASNRIHIDALPLFRGKCVRIVEHRDAAGRKAGENWSKQLWQAGAANVDGLRFECTKQCGGELTKDLADFATMLHEENGVSAQILADLAPLARS